MSRTLSDLLDNFLLVVSVQVFFLSCLNRFALIQIRLPCAVQRGAVADEPRRTDPNATAAPPLRGIRAEAVSVAWRVRALSQLT